MPNTPSPRTGRAHASRKRLFLLLEPLEDRALLNATVDWQLVDARPYTTTEVMAGIRSARPLADLAAVAAGRTALAGLVDVARSEVLFGRDGLSTVQIALRLGADPRAALRALQHVPFVTWAAPNYIYPGDLREFTPDDPLVSQQYHHTNLRNYQAWDYWFGSQNIVIAVTDDGVDMNHPDLRQNIWINQAEIPPTRINNLTDVDKDGWITFLDLNYPINQGPFKANDVAPAVPDGVIDARDLRAAMQMSGGQDLGGGGWANLVDDGGNTYVDDLVGWNTASNNNNPQGGSHGTHVAGIAAARTHNGIGVAGTAGHVRIMPILFSCCSPATSGIVARSYAYAADNGAKILTVSYNVDGLANDPTFLAGVEYTYASGVLHFNSGGNNSQADSPRQRIDSTLYVCSTNQADVKSGFSNWGYGMDLCTPGENIRSTLLGGSYGLNSGTSMASPNAAGVAALLWSIVPDWTREQIAAQVLGSCDNIDAQNPTYAGRLGCGRANSFRALTDIVDAPRIRRINFLPDEGGSTSGQITFFNVDLANVFEPWTVDYAPNWELREAGLDGVFDTADDVQVPFIHGTTMGTGYRIGTNRMHFALQSALPPGTYRFRIFAGEYDTYTGLFDPFYQPLDGNGDGTGGDNFNRHFTVLGAAPGGGGAAAVVTALDETVLSAGIVGLVFPRPLVPIVTERPAQDGIALFGLPLAETMAEVAPAASAEAASSWVSALELGDELFVLS